LSNPPFATITFLSATHLFSIAQAAVERLKNVPDRDSGHHDACVAILFAAAALEAFANEVGYIARGPLEVNPEIKSLGQLFEELETSASVQSKFLLLRALLAKEAYDKGASPYQDFALLIALRNELVHRKAERYEVDALDAPLNTNTLLERLQSKSMLAEPHRPQVWGFFLAIETPAVARWAAKSAAAMVKDIVVAAPPEFRKYLEGPYGLILAAV
jgi:hypothetical protein